MKARTSLFVLGTLFVVAWSFTEPSLSSKETGKNSNLLMVSDLHTILWMDKDKMSSREQSEWFQFCQDHTSTTTDQSGFRFGVEFTKKHIYVVVKYDSTMSSRFKQFIESSQPSISDRFIVIYNGKTYRTTLAKKNLSLNSPLVFYYVFDIVNY